MISGQNSVMLEIAFLSDLLEIAKSEVSHTVGNFLLHPLNPNATADVEGTVPQDKVLLITYLHFEAYPLDEGDVEIFAERQLGCFIDPVNFAILLDDVPLLGPPGLDTNPYQNWTGHIFLPVGAGNLKFQATLIANDPPITVDFHFSGFMLPAGTMPTLRKLMTKPLLLERTA